MELHFVFSSIVLYPFIMFPFPPLYRHDDYSHGQGRGSASGREVHTAGSGGGNIHQEPTIQGWEAPEGCICIPGRRCLPVSDATAMIVNLLTSFFYQHQ